MTALRQVRQALIEGLADSLGDDFSMFPDPNSIRDLPTRPTLVLIRSTVEKLPAAPRASYSNALTLVLIDNRTEDEDHLDDLLDAVLAALDDVPAVIFTTATRSTYGDSNPAYEIALTAYSTKE
jgi:hypothetical protein